MKLRSKKKNKIPIRNPGVNFTFKPNVIKLRLWYKYISGNLKIYYFYINSRKLLLCDNIILKIL